MSATMTPAKGGTVSAITGDALAVPPGALSAETTITLTPSSVPAGSGSVMLGAVELAPDGLRFTTPASLTIGLRSPRTPGEGLSLAYPLPGTGQALDSGALLVVDASGRTATGPIEHFSDPIAELTCFGGALENLREKVGWSVTTADITARTQLTRERIEDPRIGRDDFSRIVNAFFVRHGHVAASDASDPTKLAPFPPDEQDAITTSRRFGRQVLLLFRGAENGPLAHAAIVTLQGEDAWIVNRLNVTNRTSGELVKAIEGGTIPEWSHPLAQIDSERWPAQGVRGLKVAEAGHNLAHPEYPMPGRDAAGRVWGDVEVWIEKDARIDGAYAGGLKLSCPGVPDAVLAWTFEVQGALMSVTIDGKPFPAQFTSYTPANGAVTFQVTNPSDVRGSSVFLGAVTVVAGRTSMAGSWLERHATETCSGTWWADRS